MFLNLTNKITDSYSSKYEYAIAILASLMVYRELGTMLILVFITLNLIFYKKLEFNSKKLLPIAIIAIPIILDLFFLWNNEELSEGLKHLEKRLSFFIFPLLIISQPFSINLRKILKIYSVIFCGSLFMLLVRFIVENPELIRKYIEGVDLWEMGYAFASSTSVHAPALNMHVSFLVIVNMYLLVTHFIYQKGRILNYRLILFVGSILMLLIINTRLAIANALIGILLVLFNEVYIKKVSSKKMNSFIAGIGLIFFIVLFGFIKVFPYITEKYTSVTFAHVDKIGQLDEFENPEGEIFNSLVTRLSIWKTAWDRAQNDLLIGVGAADGKHELNQAYIDTNQIFLQKYKFPTHNQYLDYLLKFGIFGLLGLLIFIFYSFWIGWKLNSSIALFFSFLCFASNLTDDFFIRYDGITFFALWLSIFTNIYWNTLLNKD
ncbi:O-antigen ligase family protein [Psychroflexus sp. CAK57W]|uniref:O-antigen ligase family protein n=1 Tax=Psychroflexus curvus TaxID=2873595 RepID=UPI001CCF49BF|nr:O-antigen ligase family protein [Psychroflexus curvus]MBZ9627123.1 O-antigen ligase family protein [Psychroflexus curvus]MBZ9787129.1 O-antigen ligase family protein [Psychroflexus curvus]